MFPLKSTCFYSLLLQVIQMCVQSSFIELPGVEKLMDFSFIEMFLENQSFINIFHINDDTKAEEIVNRIIKLGSITSSRTFTLNSRDVKNTLNIILIDSLEHFPAKTILKSSKLHLVILTSKESSENDFQKCFEMFLMKNILSVYIAYTSEETFTVVTFNPFSHKNCYDSTPVIMKNFKSVEFLEKHLTNFYECPLRVGVYVSIPFLMCFKNNSTCNFEDMTGRDVELLKTLSNSLNFSLEEEIFEIDETKETFNALTSNQTDVILGDLFLKHDRIKIVDASVSYATSDLAFVVPKGEPFTPLERLAKPFRSFVWFALVATLLIAIFVIIFIKFQQVNVQNFVFGYQNRIPILSMASIVFGVSQHRLPSGTFARFILMNFILFCLIMRSLYQGSAYRFLQSEINHKATETIKEMIIEDFDFYFYETSIDVLENEVDRSKVKTFKLIKLDAHMMNISDSSSHKSAFAVSRSMCIYFRNNNNYEYEISKENIIIVPIVIYYQKGSFLAEAFDAKLGQIISSGLVDYWQRQFLIKVPVKPSTQLKVLTVKHFSGTFQIFFVGCLVSILTFIIELLKVRFQ